MKLTAVHSAQCSVQATIPDLSVFIQPLLPRLVWQLCHTRGPGGDPEYGALTTDQRCNKIKYYHFIVCVSQEYFYFIHKQLMFRRERKK